MGTMGIKLGMTTLYDNWGDIVPVTIVLLDRVQVVQIKKPEPGKLRTIDETSCLKKNTFQRR